MERLITFLMVILLFINLFLYMAGSKMDSGGSDNEISFSGAILEEEFDNNRLGWMEESTDFHLMDVNEGKYLINSIDTGSSRSSANCMHDKFLYDLPLQYEISTSMTLLDQKRRKTHYGLILASPSLEYTFEVHANGKVQVREYDNNRESYETLVSEEMELPEGMPVEMSVRINDTNFEFLVNNQPVGAGQFRSQTAAWRGLRLYTSGESSTAFDYLRIK